MNNLGEVFFDGKIVRLNNADNTELEIIFDELENNQSDNKVSIDRCLEKMRKELKV